MMTNTNNSQLDLHKVIKDFCENNGEKIETFAMECGLDRRQLYRIMNGTGTLKESVANKIATKLGIEPHMVYLLYTDKRVFEKFKIKHRDDDTKAKKAVAGKICWNPKLKSWEYQIMLYNEQIDPPDYSHPVWISLSKHTLPQRPGVAPWENHQYLLFTLEE
ncbi:helix-turn-helix domain-containing protein [Pseudomonadota bacterium]